MKKSSNSVSRVFENMDAVKRFLKTSEGSNSCLEQKKVLEAAGITLGRPELEELMLVLENQGAVQCFLDLCYGTKQATILRDLGINPDRDKLSRVMEDIKKTPSNFIDKAERYVTLNALKGGAKLCTKAAEEVAKLRRELAARGLDPQHVVGLEYRALVFDNRALVQSFVNMRNNDKRRATTIAKLMKLGIAPDKQRLEHMLADFKLNAKKIDKKKGSGNINMARITADADIADLNAEMAAEGARIAAAANAIGLSVEELEGIAEHYKLAPLEFAEGVKEFVAAENAKKERQCMVDESFATFVSSTITATA